MNWGISLLAVSWKSLTILSVTTFCVWARACCRSRRSHERRSARVVIFIDCARIPAEDLRECQLRFDAAARRGNGSGVNLVLPIEFVDFLVCRVVGRMFDLEISRVCGRPRLRKERAID